MKETVAQIAQLLEETQQAHHHAFLAEDGADSEWPLWYADYLQDKLPPLLEADLTKSELTYLLVHLGKLQQLEAPGGKWARFYAKTLAEKYL